MNKAQLIRVVRETAEMNVGFNLTREQKQQVFNEVCDGLFQQGKITKKQQQAWTHAF